MIMTNLANVCQGLFSGSCIEKVQLIKIKSIFQKIEIAYHGKICQG